MAPNRKIYALKRIRLDWARPRGQPPGFIDEITLLQRLRGHSNIIQLIDAEVGPHSSRMSIPLLSEDPALSCVLLCLSRQAHHA